MPHAERRSYVLAAVPPFGRDRGRRVRLRPWCRHYYSDEGMSFMSRRDPMARRTASDAFLKAYPDFHRERVR